MLSGGAAVAAYTENRYLTRDLDFVTSARLDVVAEALRPLGFERPRRAAVLRAPGHGLLRRVSGPGPPAVGHRQVRDWGEIDSGLGPVKILTPTQMVMDRLAAWVHWADPQSFDQALWIAEHHPIEFDVVEAWAAEEGVPKDKYARFRSRCWWTRVHTVDWAKLPNVVECAQCLFDGSNEDYRPGSRGNGRRHSIGARRENPANRLPPCSSSIASPRPIAAAGSPRPNSSSNALENLAASSLERRSNSRGRRFRFGTQRRRVPKTCLASARWSSTLVAVSSARGPPPSSSVSRSVIR